MMPDLTAIGGLIGLLISIGLLAWQTHAVARQTAISNRIAGVSAINEATAGLREVHMLFVAAPSLRPYFYENKSYPRSKTARDRVRVVAEQLLDAMEDGLCAHRLVPSSGPLEDWTVYCEDMLAVRKVLSAAACERPKYWPELYRMTGRRV
jgi:hypothetical protein